MAFNEIYSGRPVFYLLLWHEINKGPRWLTHHLRHRTEQGQVET